MKKRENKFHYYNDIFELSRLVYLCICQIRRTIWAMNIYTSALNYFRELSLIPRMPLHEEKARNWIIEWAEEK